MAAKNTTTQRWRIRTDELETRYLELKRCLHQPLPKIAGIGQTDFYQLDQGLSYIETSYKPAKNLAIANRIDLQEPRMVVTLAIKGHSSFKSQAGDEVLFSEGFTTITTFNSSIGERHYVADEEATQLRFSVSKKWVGQYIDENFAKRLFSKSGIQQISFRPLTLQGFSAARQMLACNVDTQLKRLFMQGQAMTVLATELTHLLSNNLKNPEKFNLRDMHAAHSARDILIREFRNPPTVQELAKRAGINQFKLKQLFHHFFNNTPYGLILEIRMKQAYELLESKRCQVSYAADFVGYSHTSNFSAAFIRYFGISPKIVAKKTI
jgi:AraC family transcriptional regulator, transcriptional activator of the genes for pyochelin and ferripyochelin receptors